MEGSPIAITMGEPAGIGGEVLLKAWLDMKVSGPVFLAIDDPVRLSTLSKRLGFHVPIREIASPVEASRWFGAALPVLPCKLSTSVEPGMPCHENAQSVISSIERAVSLATAGEASAVVTNPIQKSVLSTAGFPYPGHTEFLGALADVSDTVMMLVGPDLKVVPLTIHVPLADVPRILTTDLIIRVARTVHGSLRRQFGIMEPRLALAGLNPHAGEGGTIGREEIEIMMPAVETLRREGIQISQPLSADTLFHEVARKTYDAALCPTHDQALIPLKTLAFDEGVNMTLGLPFIRTSPDHGTALDIAGRGLARPDSLVAAIRLAATLSSPKLLENAHANA